MRTKRLSVCAIEQGTVIDHIIAGKALEVVSLLNLQEHSGQVTIGLGLSSASLGRKDLIKIEDRELSADEANRIAVLAPECTIAIISGFKVTRKFKVSLPSELHGRLPCPNPMCISNHEPLETRFEVNPIGLGAQLVCHYCREIFRRDQLHKGN